MADNIPLETEYQRCWYCGHYFHKKLLYKRLCATCRLDIAGMVERGEW